MMARRALVTGGTGFIGSRLIGRLLEEGWDVSALVLPGPQVCPLDHRVTSHELDGSTATVVRAVNDARPDAVFHLASLFLAEHRPDQVEPLISANVLFGTQLLEAMDAAGGTPTLINTGTSWQHYGGAAYDPVCLYAATKQAFEDIAAYYVNARGLRMVTLQLFDTYGPGDPRPKLFHALRTAATEGRVLEMSAGEQLIDLVHIDDVVEAFLIASARGARLRPGTSEVWAVSSPARLTLRELVERWRSITGLPLEVHWGGRPYRPREVMLPWCGPVLEDWVPKVGLDEGIALMESHSGAVTA